MSSQECLQSLMTFVFNVSLIVYIWISKCSLQIKLTLGIFVSIYPDNTYLLILSANKKCYILVFYWDPILVMFDYNKYNDQLYVIILQLILLLCLVSIAFVVRFYPFLPQFCVPIILYHIHKDGSQLGALLM